MPESENTETPPVEIPEIAKTPDKAPETSAPDPATYKKKRNHLRATELYLFGWYELLLLLLVLLLF